MNTDCSFVIGKTHHVCEDYAMSGNEFIIISDGCSGSTDTDIGARIMVKTASRHIDGLLTGDPEVFVKEVITGAQEHSSAMALHDTCLDATLLVAVAGHGVVKILCAGDGAVVLGCKDGGQITLGIKYTGGYPFYCSYLLDQERLDGYNMLDNRIDVECMTGASISFDMTKKYSYEEKILFIEAPLDDLSYAALFSDGIFSFYENVNTGTSSVNKTVPCKEVMRGLLDFKATGGEFVKRRVRRYLVSHAKGFDGGTDWFSWAVVTFQMFTGIHPYKGKYKSALDLDTRMMKNISVFNPFVSVPKICEPFDVIPENLRRWYKAVFEDGKRLPPPDIMVAAFVIVPAASIENGKIFDIVKKAEFDKDIVMFQSFNGTDVIVAGDDGYIGGVKCFEFRKGDAVVITPKMNRFVLASIDNARLSLSVIPGMKKINCTVKAEELMSFEGRLYVKNGGNLLEIGFVETGDEIVTAPKIVANIMERSSHVFRGAVMEEMLGAWFACLVPATGLCHHVRMKELEKYRIIDAVYEHGLLMVIGEKAGVYDKFIFRFTPAYDLYDVRIITGIDQTDLNFTVLDNGICVHQTGDGSIELFTARYGDNNIRLMKDESVGSLIITKDGVRTLGLRGKFVHSISMRK